MATTDMKTGAPRTGQVAIFDPAAGATNDPAAYGRYAIEDVLQLRPKTITVADSPYAVLVTDRFLLVDASGGDVEVDFLLAADAYLTQVKKIDTSANLVQCTPQAGETVEGESGSYDLSVPGQVENFVSDGVSAHHKF